MRFYARLEKRENKKRKNQIKKEKDRKGKTKFRLTNIPIRYARYDELDKTNFGYVNPLKYVRSRMIVKQS